MIFAWRRLAVGLRSVLLFALWCWSASVAFAQEPPPRIGPFVFDVHGTVPRFPDNAVLAESRGISVAELPGSGIGLQIAAHVYLVKIKIVTVGVGAEAVASRAHETPLAGTSLRAVTEQFRTLDGQVSLNFGSGNGWSYISGGIGQAIWSIVPDGQEPLFGDDERLKTVNYGVGARWFAKRHLAFSFDVRFYAINPGTGSFGYPGSPRTTLMAIAAGVSVK